MQVSPTTPGLYGSEHATLQERRWGREVDFFAPDACRLTQADWDHNMGRTFEARKVDTPKPHLVPPGPPLTKIRLTDLRRVVFRQRNFKAHPQDTLPPEMWKILARFDPGFLKTVDDTTQLLLSSQEHAPLRHFGLSHRPGLAGFHAPLTQTTGSVSLCLRRGCRDKTRGCCGSGTQHPSKMPTSRFVLPVQTSEMSEELSQTSHTNGKAASGRNAEGTRSKHPPQPARQHDTENTWRWRLENYKGYEAV